VIPNLSFLFHMNKVLPNLYIGSFEDSVSAAQLEKFQISHILTAAAGINEKFANKNNNNSSDDDDDDFDEDGDEVCKYVTNSSFLYLFSLFFLSLFSLLTETSLFHSFDFIHSIFFVFLQ